MLTPVTKAQLDLSRKIAKKLNTPSIAEIKSVIMQCLNRDPSWIKVSKKALIGLKSDNKIRLDPAKIALRSAFDNGCANQNDKAILILDKEINNTSEDPLKALLLSRKAAFQHVFDADAAQKTLVAAHTLEPRITKPIQGVTYKKLAPAAGQQASSLIAYHRKRFMDSTSMKLFVDELCSDLQFKQETADKFEAAINDLACFLGVSGQRPDREFKEGPDNLWALPNSVFLVIECKNGVSPDSKISKDHAGQLGQSIAWFNSRYPASQAIPIIIHPQSKLGQGASLIEGIRVINQKKLEKICKNLRDFAGQLSNPDVACSANGVASRLTQFEFSAETFVNAFTLPVKQ